MIITKSLTKQLKLIELYWYWYNYEYYKRNEINNNTNLRFCILKLPGKRRIYLKKINIISIFNSRQNTDHNNCKTILMDYFFKGFISPNQKIKEGKISIITSKSIKRFCLLKKFVVKEKYWVTRFLFYFIVKK